MLAPQPFFAPRGTPHSVYFRALTMSEQGARIDLLTYGEGTDVDIPGVRQIRIPHPPFVAPVRIGPSPLKALLDLVMLGVFVRQLMSESYDVVHAHEESVFFAALLKPVFGYGLVYDMHSSLPQQLSNFRTSRSRLLIGLFRALERLSLQRADLVITICQDLAAYAEARMPDPTRQHLIENTRFEPVRFADGEAVKRDRPSRFEFPECSRVIFYAGSFEPYQGLDLVIQAFADVALSHPDAKLVLAGGSPEQIAHLAAMAKQAGVRELCLFPGSIPQEDVRRLLTRATVLLSSRVSGTNTPLKIYEQISSGVPLVATRILSHTQVLDDSIAILVEPTPRGLAEGLKRALSGEEGVRQKAVAARETAHRDYSPEMYRHKIAAFLDMLC